VYRCLREVESCRQIKDKGGPLVLSIRIAPFVSAVGLSLRDLLLDVATRSSGEGCYVVDTAGYSDYENMSSIVLTKYGTSPSRATEYPYLVRHLPRGLIKIA
jgi:hypothetical protein